MHENLSEFGGMDGIEQLHAGQGFGGEVAAEVHTGDDAVCKSRQVARDYN